MVTEEQQPDSMEKECWGEAMSDILIYTSPCVISSEHEIIRDGAVVVNAERILETGPKDQVIKSWNDSRKIALSGILMPPLINCHIHLELSHFSDISRPDPGHGMVGWIEEVMQKRQSSSLSQQDLSAAYDDTLRQQKESGVVLLADIANNIEQPLPPSSIVPEVYRIFEMIAPTQSRTAEAIKHLQALPPTQPVSPHSPYSTTKDLICALKKRAMKNDQLFSIHLAESKAEIELLKTGTGDFRKFLESRGAWDGALTGGEDFTGAVQYLESLSVLDDKTLCVHCIHLGDEEIALLAEKKAKVCLCPGSNDFLGVGQPPLEKMLQAGILPGIGTDSAASNKSLDIWREMKILRAQNPKVPAAKIFAMATQGGARSLQREGDFGTLEKGKKSLFLEIDQTRIDELSNTEIVDLLTSGGRPEKVTWISPAGES